MGKEITKRNLEDPLVDDNDSDIESPPLKDSQERSKHAPLANNPFFHHPTQMVSVPPLPRRKTNLCSVTVKTKEEEELFFLPL